MTFHRLLMRQLKKYLPNQDDQNRAEQLLSAVSEAYVQNDQDRAQLERSIHLTSNELLSRNQTLSRQLKQLKQIQGALEDSFSLLHATLNSTHEAILVLDSNGMVRLVNNLFQTMFQIDQIDTPFSSLDTLCELIKPQIRNGKAFSTLIYRSISECEDAYEAEFETLNNRSIEAYSSPHYQGGEAIGQVWSFRDVTELKLKEDEAKHRAHHDILTGLPNRRLLNIRLKQSLSHLSDNKHVFVLFIDLDGFKDVNDSMGHSVGDALLKEVSKRFESLLPDHSNHTLVRYGGDEFVVVVDGQTGHDNIVKLCQTFIQSFAIPFQLGSEDVYISASIGVAFAPDNGVDADRLLSCADTAMYQAKRKGKNTFEYYSALHDSHSAQRVKIRSQLNTALAQNELELFFQPKIALKTGKIVGAEALIRWQVNPNEYRSPIEFIPIAESSGQIIPISQWVIKRCCQHLSNWSEKIALKDFVLALNISAKHFQKGQLQDDIAEMIKLYDVSPQNLELEVTETAIMEDLELGVNTLSKLRELGIRTAIDDFGTGYSSLSYLRKLPIDILKIDKSFIDEIIVSDEDRTLVQGIIDMVHALGMKVVAEGVENNEMADILTQMGCDEAQGYYYCRPVPEVEFLNLFQKSRKNFKL